jgi:hypothetical protein
MANMNAASRAQFRDLALQWIRERARVEGGGAASIDSHSASGDDGSAAVVIIDRQGEAPLVLTKAFGDGNAYEQGLLAIAGDTVEYMTQMRVKHGKP